MCSLHGDLNPLPCSALPLRSAALAHAAPLSTFKVLTPSCPMSSFETRPPTRHLPLIHQINQLPSGGELHRDCRPLFEPPAPLTECHGLFLHLSLLHAYVRRTVYEERISPLRSQQAGLCIIYSSLTNTNQLMPCHRTSGQNASAWVRVLGYRVMHSKVGRVVCKKAPPAADNRQ